MKKKCTSFLAMMLFIVMGVNVASYDLAWAETNTADGQIEADKTIENVEEKMDFLYIESSELESPGTQNIAVAWDKDMGNVHELVLVYSDSEGNTYELKESARAEKSVLFAKEFSSSEVSTYKIKGMKYFVNGSEEEQYLDFKDLEIKADFKVVNNQNDSVTEVVDSNVATTSTNADELSEDVEALLETADAEPANDDGKVVVVIDPGHGGSQPGACSNGLIEKNLTLKISKYFRDELREYSGVEVYMTRETDRDVSDGGDDELSKRVEYAEGVNADILISVHINSTGTGKASGAEVWAPNKNYNRYNIHEIGQGVAKDIQTELVKLGLKDRGVQTSYSKNNTQYADGSLADYYAIIRESKEHGFPGIIVEHAFIDNANDAAFLKSEANLKALGIADATGVANYFGLKKASATIPTPDEATPADVDTELKNAGFCYAEFTAPDQEVANMRGFEPGSDVSTYIAKLNAIEAFSNISYTDADGNAITSGMVETGQIITFEMGDKTYTRNVVVAGDVDGDGKIFATDYVRIKNHIMNVGSPLSGVYKCAADVNGDTKIYATDYVITRNHIMETGKITQLLEFKVYQLN